MAPLKPSPETTQSLSPAFSRRVLDQRPSREGASRKGAGHGAAERTIHLDTRFDSFKNLRGSQADLTVSKAIRRFVDGVKDHATFGDI